MGKSSLPPFFVEVSIAACVAAFGITALVRSLPAAPASEQGTIAAEMTSSEGNGGTSGESATGSAAGTEAKPARHGEQVVRFDTLGHDIVVTGSRLSDDDLREQLQRFRRNVRPFENSGQRLGVYIHNLTTGATVSYNADEPFYSASSIKAPYCLAVYERAVDPGIVPAGEIAHLTELTLVESDNDTYQELSERCGRQVFVDWAVDCGALEKDSEAYHQLIVNRHWFISPRQLGTMWEHGYDYLQAGSDGAEELKGYLERRYDSPLRDGLPADATTYAKAGWYPEDLGPDYCATVDAGIARIKGYDYVIAVMTSMPADLDRLSRLMPGVLSARSVTA